jgi:hypothetical protein
MDRDSNPWMLPILLAAGVAAAAWYYWTELQQQTLVEPNDQYAAPPQMSEHDPDSGPRHPITEVSFPDGAEAELQPLPSLDDSDEYFKLELGGLFGDQIGALLADTRIVERVVATVDNLPRSHVAERIRPVTGLADAFVADPEGGDLYVIGQESYRRYDDLVGIIEQSDVSELTDLYRRYYPLFQSAYEDLGYPNRYFNDRLVEAIDDMLATPDLAGKISLVRPHVLYKFENPDLEARSSGQKLLLRMGGDNSAKIKMKLKELREKITSGEIS